MSFALYVYTTDYIRYRSRIRVHSLNTTTVRGLWVYDIDGLEWLTPKFSIPRTQETITARIYIAFGAKSIHAYTPGWDFTRDNMSGSEQN